jgi:hypothetical protein
MVTITSRDMMRQCDTREQLGCEFSVLGRREDEKRRGERMNKERTLFSIIFCRLDLDSRLDFGILVALRGLLAAGNTDTRLDEGSSHH